MPEMERFPRQAALGRGAEPTLCTGRSLTCTGSVRSPAPHRLLPLGTRVPSSPAKMALAGVQRYPQPGDQSPKQITCKTLRQKRGYAPRAAHCWQCTP